MICKKCGADAGDYNFCPSCGAPTKAMPTKCSHCGKEIQDGQFCPHCGAPAGEPSSENVTDKLKEVFKKMTGGSKGNVKFSLSDLYKDVFKPHTKEEKESLIICGTEKTTPSLETMSSSWCRPWLYVRVFGILALTFALLLVCVQIFENALAFPGLLFIGALMMPFSLLVLFWEANVPRNISFFHLIVMFFVGGMGSLVCSLSIFSFISPDELDVGGAIIVGIVEEIGKLVMVAVFIHLYKCKYLLNGILVGAAVGAGFAVFESAGYALVSGDPVQNIILRGVLSAGGHLVWAAMSGAAIMLAKGAKPFSANVFASVSFWMLFPVPVVLHALWDMPFSNMVVLALLVVIAWVFILALLRAGMAEINRLCEQHSAKTGQAKP